MNNLITRPVTTIVAGMLLIIAGFLIPLLNNNHWDNFIYEAALGIGVVMVLIFFTKAIMRGKTQA